MLNNSNFNYFGDLIKGGTGNSAHEYIHNKLIEVAKEKSFDLDNSVSEIAYEVIFKHPHHGIPLFKNITGGTHKEFKN